MSSGHTFAMRNIVHLAHTRMMYAILFCRPAGMADDTICISGDGVHHHVGIGRVGEKLLSDQTDKCVRTNVVVVVGWWRCCCCVGGVSLGQPGGKFDLCKLHVDACPFTVHVLNVFLQRQHQHRLHGFMVDRWRKRERER